LIPKVFAGKLEPLRIVFTTLVGDGPAALLFSPAIADGSIAREAISVIATRNLLLFMVHQFFCLGNQV
jgi:hypothetical protein